MKDLAAAHETNRELSERLASANLAYAEEGPDGTDGFLELDSLQHGGQVGLEQGDLRQLRRRPVRVAGLGELLHAVLTLPARVLRFGAAR